MAPPSNNAVLFANERLSNKTCDEDITETAPALNALFPVKLMFFILTMSELLSTIDPPSPSSAKFVLKTQSQVCELAEDE